jgi:sec-independent protein translocase protein TatA
MLGRLGWQELLIIFILVFVIFGSSKLPGIVRGFGQSVKEFKTAVREDDEEKDEKKQS